MFIEKLDIFDLFIELQIAIYTVYEFCITKSNNKKNVFNFLPEYNLPFLKKKNR